MSHRVRLGLIGVGVIARYYLQALKGHRCAVLRAVCDHDTEKLRPFEGAEVFATTDVTQLLGSSAIDAVIVSPPNDHHAKTCAAALEAGKHVCCEKPLTLRGTDARALAALAERRGLTLFTAFHRRYNRNVIALWRRVLDHRARGGTIRSVHVRYFEHIREHCGPDAWYLDPRRCGGGVLADNGPNALDLVHLFLGDVEVERAEVEHSRQGVDIRARVECRARTGNTTAAVLLDWEYGCGELKDIAVTTDDRRVDRADMLEGFTAFKSSLDHEYFAILDDFVAHIRANQKRTAAGPDGVEIVRLGERARAIARDVSSIQFRTQDERNP